MDFPANSVGALRKLGSPDMFRDTAKEWEAPIDVIPTHIPHHHRELLKSSIGSARDVYARLATLSSLIFDGNEVPSGMGVLEVDLTPELCIELSKLNIPINRDVTTNRKKTVTEYFDDWDTTTVIMISASGLLIDGNGRVSTIAEREAGECYPALILYGLPTHKFFKVDRNKPRTAAETNFVHPELMSVSTFFSVFSKQVLARNLSDATRMDFVDLVRPQFRELMNLYSSRVPMWGSDAVRAAVIYLSLTAPEDAMHARDQYRAICTNSKDGMCSSVYAMKTLIEDAAIAPRGKATVFSGCLNANHKKELIFMIALRAFARANKNHKIIRNFDSEEIRDQVRKNILSAVQPIELKRLSHADA